MTDNPLDTLFKTLHEHIGQVKDELDVLNIGQAKVGLDTILGMLPFYVTPYGYLDYRGHPLEDIHAYAVSEFARRLSIGHG